MYRAFGLVIAPGWLRGSDQSPHVESGRAELPLRVRIPTPGRKPRQEIRPHLATVPASRTGDSYHPAAGAVFNVDPSRRSSFPRFPVATSNPRFEESSRVASPSFASATMVARKADSGR